MAVKEPKLRRYFRYYYRVLFPETKNKHSVAFSVFLGVFIGVLPTLGIAVPLTVLATELFRVPKGPGIVSSFIATPPTLFLFFYPLGYLTGSALIQPPSIEFEFLAEFKKIGFTTAGTVLSDLWVQAKEHVIAFLLGMFIIASVTGIIAYVATFIIMRRRTRDESEQE